VIEYGVSVRKGKSLVERSWEIKDKPELKSGKSFREKQKVPVKAE